MSKKEQGTRNRRYSIAAFLALLLSSIAFIASCSGDDDDAGGEQITAAIGVVQSLSGAAGVYGKSVVNGIELAVIEINDSEEDVSLSILLQDDASTVEGGRPAFQKVIDSNVAAIIGPTLSNVALEVFPMAQTAGVPVLSATTTAPGITEIGDYIFRIALTEAIVVPATIERLHDETPIETAVLVFDGSDAFSRGSAEAMRDGMAGIEGAIVAEVDVSKDDLDAALAGLRGEAPDAFLITPLVDQAADIVDTVRAAGFESMLIGGNSFNTLAITGAAGDAIEGAYVGAAWNPAAGNDTSKRFVAAYTQKYGEAPDLFAAQGYSSVYVLLEALKQAGAADGPALRDAIAGVSDVETPLGELSFSESRDALHDPVVQRFQGGELVVLP